MTAAGAALAFAGALALPAPGAVAAPAQRAEPPAHAAGPTGCQAVHAGPRLAADEANASYFRLTLQPGEQIAKAVLVANPQPYPCAVTLHAAYGQTATNSGDTYPVPDGQCVETSCWLTGLPTTVTVPAGARVDVGFVVTVPADAPSGEYLAGVLVEPAAPPPSPRVSGDGQVGVAVAAHVAVGVAVTVPGPLSPKIVIPTVTLDVSSGTPILGIPVRNLGNTWEHPIGGARVHVGNRVLSFGVRANTVLAGDEALIPLPIDGVARGEHETEVVLSYGNGLKATWHGTLGYPTPPARATPSSETSATAASAGLPVWALALIGGLGFGVVLLGFTLLVVTRRRRGHAAPPARGPDRPQAGSGPSEVPVESAQ
ncbi:MAG TPA: hypothetical protein VFC99_00775 [Acidimicrobiia bacterium]|nr:hypothetical protein [Acidimicrobiia bacterium]